MTSLEFCHELEFSKINFIERKIRITHPKTILFGPPKSGKSFLIFDYLSNFDSKEYIYIDFNDTRNTYEEIEKNLQEFVIRNNIKVIVLENFDFQFKIPYCDSVIITSKQAKKEKGFKNLFLNPLDFEEYLLHDKKNQNITHLFNNFLRYGNLPETLQTPDYKIYESLQDLIKLINKDETCEEILKILVFNIDEKKSLNQIFLTLKEKIKISKDKFYEECKRLENEKIIYFLPKFMQEKAVKKIYTYNCALFSSITHKKKFKNELTNLIFLELLNRHKELYYLDYIDFYIPDENIAIVSIPFFNSTMMQSQLKRIKRVANEHDIKELYVISVSNNEHFFIQNLEVNVLPFYEWALS